MQVSQAIIDFVLLKVPITYRALNGELIETQLFYPINELTYIFYDEFSNWKEANPQGGIIEFKELFFNELIYVIYPLLTPLQQQAIGDAQINIANFVPSDVASQDRETRLNKKQHLTPT